MRILVTIVFLFASVSIAETSNRPRMIVLGDSLTEGYGVPKEAAYPALLQKKFDDGGIQVEVINAGISGSTTASAPKRYKWLRRQKPKYLLLALGGNDGLRGFKPAASEANLAKTIEAAQKDGVTVILAGIKAPPNYGMDYTEQFSAIYPRLAKRFKVALIPFLLD